MVRHTVQRRRACAFGFVSILSAASFATADIRVYDASAAVQSAKRGVAANFLNDADFTALSPGASWWYNYAPTPNGSVQNGVVPAGAGMEFRPFVFNGNASGLSGLTSYLAAGNRPSEIMTVNEPNLSGQAVMTPAQAATVYKNVKAIADKYGIPVSGPQMPAGGDTGVTSTKDYLAQFYAAAATNNTPVYGVGIHLYDNFGGLTYNLGQAITNAGGRALNVSEFANYSATSFAEQRDYLIKAVDLLERTTAVTNYAWFKERTGSPAASPFISLLSATPGVLTTLGDAYVNMPVHDANVYYRPNGRLQAERYVTMSGEDIASSTDTVAGSLADMTSTAADARLTYNLFVATAGLYTVDLRVGGTAGLITLYEGATPLGTLAATAGSFRTVTTQIYLDAGQQAFGVQLQRSGQAVNYLEFAAVPEPAAGAIVLCGAVAVLRRRRRA